MLTTSSRLLRLLSLLQSRPHWAGPALALEMDVHPRTLRRDIDRLRELGYPIQASSGVAGGYAFRAGRALPPLLLDDEDAGEHDPQDGRPAQPRMEPHADRKARLPALLHRTPSPQPGGKLQPIE